MERQVQTFAKSDSDCPQQPSRKLTMMGTAHQRQSRGTQASNEE